jgi:hypothetical protein
VRHAPDPTPNQENTHDQYEDPDSAVIDGGAARRHRAACRLRRIQSVDADDIHGADHHDVRTAAIDKHHHHEDAAIHAVMTIVRH